MCFTKLKTFKTHISLIFIIHKPSLWSRDVPQKIRARSVQPFWRLLDTNKQTPKQTDKPNFYIDLLVWMSYHHNSRTTWSICLKYWLGNLEEPGECLSLVLRFQDNLVKFLDKKNPNLNKMYFRNVKLAKWK